MSDRDCLADTPTIVLRIENGALRADAVVSSDLDNAVEVHDAGMYVPSAQNDYGRLAAVAPVGIATGAPVTVATASVRFGAPAPAIYTGGLRALKSGLYHVGCAVAWANPGGTPGRFRLVQITAQGSPPQTYPHMHQGYNNALSVTGFSTAQVQIGFNGIVYLPKGTILGLQAQHDSSLSISISPIWEDGIELYMNLLLEFDD